MVSYERRPTVGKPNPARNVTEWISPMNNDESWFGIARLKRLTKAGSMQACSDISATPSP